MPRSILPLPSVLAMLAVLALLLSITAAPNARVRDAAVHAGSMPAQHSVSITVPAGPGAGSAIELDATLYTPGGGPAPAVLLAHGFGGDKTQLRAQARRLRSRGLVVLAYTARGFGNSGGDIHLNDPRYEVADASALIDWLAQRPEVTRDAPGDPRVAVSGVSYGGALSLWLAGTDQRVDALAPIVAYTDLNRAFLPDYAVAQGSDEASDAGAQQGAGTPASAAAEDGGIWKSAWLGLLFAAGLGSDAGCGRFAADICALYQRLAVRGRSDAEATATLHRLSPERVTAQITAPTFLVQGSRDTLFGLDQADIAARDIAATGAPVRVAWFDGEHGDAGISPTLHTEIRDWLAARLGVAATGGPDASGFSYQLDSRFGSGEGSAPVPRVRTAHYPGLGGPDAGIRRLPLAGGQQPVVRPPGATPAAVTTLPGLAALSGISGGSPAAPGGQQEDGGTDGGGNDSGRALQQLSGRLAFDPPGQAARFRSPVTEEAARISGTGSTRITVARPGGGQAVLFGKLYDLGPDGTRTLVGPSVAPLRLTDLPKDGSSRTVSIALPGVVHTLQPGHRLELTIATTDRGFAVDAQPADYRVGLADGAQLQLRFVRQEGASSTGTSPWQQLATPGLLVALGLLATLAILMAVGGLRTRRRFRAAPALQGSDAGAHAPVLQVTGLSKSYPGGHVAVDGVSFSLQRGEVLGLLGPNGAGKSTVLRMLTGLLLPSAGHVRIFGHPVGPGAPALSRVGCLVEGPGLLPHVSGRQNLRLYWEATGRPEQDARLEEALQIAGLGAAADRAVRTYSQGMRQRLAIAQAMLGMPELLVLDEPTNGLDPPQIQHMRDVLQNYAAHGRSVLISSHLLAEVEQTCTHVVVMDAGVVRSQGSVTEMVTDGRSRTLVVASEDGEHATTALRSAGVAYQETASRHRLEDTFMRLIEGTPKDGDTS